MCAVEIGIVEGGVERVVEVLIQQLACTRPFGQHVLDECVIFQQGV